MKGMQPLRASDGFTKLMRRNHLLFCAKWARAAKVRFDFAQYCVDSPLNRAALQRWFLAQWKEQRYAGIGDNIQKLDQFMVDTIDMCFLPTDQIVSHESKKAVRKRARMEHFNERKFVEGWK
jgi:hypothetical protein